MSKKILFISYRLGYNSLLYWDDLLNTIKKKYPDFRVFTSTKKAKSKNNLVETEQKLRGVKIHFNKTKKNGFLFYLPMPFFLFNVKKYNPDLIIINEFNLNGLYILFFRFLLNNPKTLLLVESDPFLGYKNKHSKLRNALRRFILNKVDEILTNNQLGYKYLTNTLKTNPEKITVKPYLVSELSPDNF